jgi:glycosyltransferase involved in cell wall biosynthesis
MGGEGMEFPKFSIVIPTYNREKCVRRAIDSVLRQDFESFELIVVDDGSTDLSREVLQEYVKKDHRVRFFSHATKRIGVSVRHEIPE